MVYRFVNDYSEGAAEEIMQSLMASNRTQNKGYGEDLFCERARGLIHRHLESPNSMIHFVVGGTQANLTVISSILRPHQGVVAVDSGHINVHESGAIEATGHKVLALPGVDGKLSAASVRACFEAHYADPDREHTVQPGMVYISHPTELGTLYSKKELQALQSVCNKYKVPLYLDGARLGCALASPETDVTLSDLASYTDVFYIGGTKMGAMFGEAIVVNNVNLQKDFRYIIKQKGGMLAKGRLLGLQFESLFTNRLYFKLAAHANAMAAKLAAGMEALGYSFFTHSATNQIFPILPKALVAELDEDFATSVWCSYDADSLVVRFVTSWATPEEMVDALLARLAELTAQRK